MNITDRLIMPIIIAINVTGPTYALEARDPPAISPTIFRHCIRWNVVNPVDGYIVQHIKRNEKY